MPKERRVLSVPSNRTRVSPYPLRSSRTKKEKEPELPIQTEGPSQWEDVRCVICQEPPHNAVLLRCSSSSTGCRAYMCDTSARHSNCFKQYRVKNRNRLTKDFNCPYCRGEVYETMKVSGAVRYLNAKPRCCAFEGCVFSGSYSQLKSHLRAAHPGFTGPVVDQRRHREWEQMQRASEYTEVMTAAGIPHSHEAVAQYSLPPNPVIRLSINGVPHDRIPFNLPPNPVIRLSIDGVEHAQFLHDLPHNPMIRISISGVLHDLSLGVR
ncbi:hypothetical protein Rs2_34894 [Raphanus sativus]|uniref:Uncharacterized protein LOC108817045 n=1 Tax=Raphanus sativus TaxID=3726 RepID=A0A6J0KC61_RAPSA|nr:uncharacterized protein LOC108817045 [Raphanus sativus]XP_018445139.1 uncharacterized protein LOC108817045 [Raphanus sativus]KAJ4884801.1 hypothetical protein Rs2_34894 [Raphanus sativus]